MSRNSGFSSMGVCSRHCVEGERCACKSSVNELIENVSCEKFMLLHGNLPSIDNATFR